MAIYLDTLISVALCVGLNAPYTEGILQEQYIGCYHDISSQSNWTNGITDSNTLSIELCIQKCEQRGATYAILQNGRSCLCGDVLNVSSPDYACDTRCSGNKLQVCGGSSGAASYVIYSACPFGFYGDGCNQTCHCKQRIPCHWGSGICPSVCEDSWTLPSCSKVTSQSLSDKSIGCYLDSNNRTMEFEFGYFRGTCTVELCSATCAARNYTFAGIEVGSQCFCGDSNAKYVRQNDSSCNFKCDADFNEFCGGNWALNVYFACPTGYFGDGCMSRCNCKKEERCACANCICSSGCKSGWMGSRCEFRNCSDNNGDCSADEACVTVDLKYSSITRCNCKQGYQKKRLWDTCTDVDECYLGTHECDKLTTTCINTVGSYICDCQPGHYRVNYTTTLCHVYSIDVIIGAAIGSAAGLTVIFAIILIIVVLCRRRPQQHKQSEADANRIQLQDETDASYEKPIPQLNYETLDRNLNPDESNYTDLDRCRNQS